MPQGPSGLGLAWLVLAKMVCCIGLLLAATGTLSLGGLAGWFLDGGAIWLAIAVVAVTMFHLRHRYYAERQLRAQRTRAIAPWGVTLPARLPSPFRPEGRRSIHAFSG